MEQRSPEWFAARCGVPSASRFKDILAKTKSGPAATRTAYLYQIVSERLTGEVAESYQNTAMRWGTEHEDEALAAFIWETDIEVESAGFILYGDCGASPDGLIGDDCGIEIKCPFNSAVHVKTLDSDKMPPEHQAQVQGCMMVTNSTSWHFVSFDPRMPPKLQLFTKVIQRDDDYIKKLNDEIQAFNAECYELIERLMT